MHAFEDKNPSSSQSINTHGGASIGGDATAGEDFAGRDIFKDITINIDGQSTLWDELIKRIVRVQRESSVSDVVYWLVRLHKAMGDCHKCYKKYYDAKDTATADGEELEILRSQWLAAINDIGNAIEEIDTALQILSPETREHLGAYASLEAVAFNEGIDTLSAVSNEFSKPLELNIDKVEVSTSFEDAMERLQQLIRDNFTADEIYHASRLIDTGTHRGNAG